MLGSETVLEEGLKDKEDISSDLDEAYLAKETFSPHTLFYSTGEEAWKPWRFKVQKCTDHCKDILKMPSRLRSGGIYN